MAHADDGVELIDDANTDSSARTRPRFHPRPAKAVVFAVVGALLVLPTAWAILSGALLALRAARPQCIESLPPPSLLLKASSEMSVFIVRHGDKFSSYPHCTGTGNDTTLCFDPATMGNNPPLTPCGLQQANETADWLVDASYEQGGIQAVLSSPFLRCLETALALARKLGRTLQVEQRAGEARADQGPFRPSNAGLGSHADLQREITSLWDERYGSPPIPTPEDDVLYWARVRRLVATVRSRFTPSVANVAVYTHATTSVSLAYGLCHGDDGTDTTLQAFVQARGAIGPGGVIQVTLDASTGACKSVAQTRNVAFRCGATGPHKCEFADYPGWYWNHAEGRGAGRCS